MEFIGSAGVETHWRYLLILSIAVFLQNSNTSCDYSLLSFN